MSKLNVAINSFNRGLISSLGGARTDLERLPLSAAIYNNIIPRILGSTATRVGLGYTGATYLNNTAIHIPFIYSFTDKAILEFTDSVMRIKISDSVITRESLSTTVTSGDMSSATGWTDADESGATSGVSGGYMTLLGTGYNAAIRRQQVTVAAGDQNKEHGLRIVVTIGPVYLKIGSSSGGEEYIAETALGTGTHSIAFTPTGDFHIELAGRKLYTAKVDSCTVEDAGALTIPTPYSADYLTLMRWDQSADVIYIDCDGISPRKVIRTFGKNNTRSWSIEVYEPEDGPFLTPNTSTVKLTPSALTGDITLTASRSFFKSTNVGSLFKLTSVGQNVSVTATGAGQWSSEIRVTGVGANQRSFTITRASLGGTGTTATLQRSVGDTSSWVDVTTYTTDASASYNDGLDNQIVYYRIGVDTGDYSSGSPVLSLSYASGGLTGICRVTAYSSATSVSAIVLDNMGATTETEVWSESSWSDRRGFPTAVVLYEGRLFHGGVGKLWGSVSDDYESFDSTVTGDSATISRTLPGQIEKVCWLLSGRRLLIGTESAEFVAKSSINDEVLTQSNINIKQVSSRGAKNIPAAILDTTGIYVTRSGDELTELDYSVDVDDFRPDDLSRLIPEFLSAGITRIAVQRHPDTRIHCVLADGTAAILIFDKTEEVKAWVTIDTDGDFEDVFALPETSEDRVYYCVKRTINGSTVRYLEKFALESECQGGTTNKMADSFVTFTGVSATTITGLSHLEGEEVIVWADGVDLSPHDDDWVQTTYTVSSGQITVATGVNSAVIGLPYKGRWKSTRLAYGAEMVALTQPKKVDHLGIISQNMHLQALRYGQDFTDMDALPDIEEGTTVAANTVHSEYDNESFEFDGYWDTDARVCIETYAPRPCTLLALVIGMVTNEKG